MSLSAIGYIVFNWSSESRSEKSIDRSIAVLPFADMSPDKDQEYFSDGMTEEILTHLYKINDLVVKSRTSVMGYKGTTKNITDIAEELGVAHILEGSIRKSGDKVRITAQLIDAVNDIHLWAETYETELADVFAIQSEVSQKIASSLKAELSPEVKERVENVPTDNMQAYEYYLLGNQAYWDSWSPLNLDFAYRSIEYFNMAIELDPSFSSAYAGVGRSYWFLSGLEASTLRPDYMIQSKKFLEKAISLDPYNGWAYAEMAVVSQVWDWDSLATRNNLDMAIKLMPNDPNAYIHSFYFEARFSNCDNMISVRKSLNEIRNRETYPFGHFNILVLFCQNRYGEIARLADQYWDGELYIHLLDPVFYSYLLQSDLGKAGNVVDYAKTSLERKEDYFTYHGILSAIEGDNETALAMLDSLKAENAREVSSAKIYAALGNKEQMYSHLNQGIIKREALHQDMHLFPRLVDCQEEEEFNRIKKEIWVPREENQ